MPNRMTSNSNNQPPLLLQMGKEILLALLALLIVFGVPITTEQAGAIIGFFSAVGIALVFYLRARSVNKDEVVEQLIQGEVVAGPANDIVPTGQVVREVTPEVPNDSSTN